MAARQLTIFFSNGTKVAQTWSSTIQAGEVILKPGKQLRNIIQVQESVKKFQIGLQAGGNYTGVSLLYDWNKENWSLFPASNDFQLGQNLKRTVSVKSFFTGADNSKDMTVTSSVVEDTTEKTKDAKL